MNGVVDCGPTTDETGLQDYHERETARLGGKMTVEIPNELLLEAKHRAVEEPGGLRGLFVRALEAYLRPIGKARKR